MLAWGPRWTRRKSTTHFGQREKACADVLRFHKKFLGFKRWGFGLVLVCFPCTATVMASSALTFGNRRRFGGVFSPFARRTWDLTSIYTSTATHYWGFFICVYFYLVGFLEVGKFQLSIFELGVTGGVYFDCIPFVLADYLDWGLEVFLIHCNSVEAIIIILNLYLDLRCFSNLALSGRCYPINVLTVMYPGTFYPSVGRAWLRWNNKTEAA